MRNIFLALTVTQEQNIIDIYHFIYQSELEEKSKKYPASEYKYKQSQWKENTELSAGHFGPSRIDNNRLYESCGND